MRARRAVGASNLFRGKVWCAVQRRKEAAGERPVGLQRTALVEGLDDLEQQRREGWRGNPIEQVADLLVAGEAMHPEQRRGVVASALLLHPGLVVEKRRALSEEHRKGGEPGVLHRVTRVVAALTHVG